MTKIKTSPFNPFDYFETNEEIQAFLQDALHDENPEVFVTVLGHWVRHHGVAEVAESTGLNRESLYKTLSGKTKPSWATVHKLLLLLRKNYAL